jgi:hypothetical protein
VKPRALGGGGRPPHHFVAKCLEGTGEAVAGRGLGRPYTCSTDRTLHTLMLMSGDRALSDRMMRGELPLIRGRPATLQAPVLAAPDRSYFFARNVIESP